MVELERETGDRKNELRWTKILNQFFPFFLSYVWLAWVENQEIGSAITMVEGRGRENQLYASITPKDGISNKGSKFTSLLDLS